MILIPTICFSNAFIAFEGVLTVLQLYRRAAVNPVYYMFAMDCALLCSCVGLSSCAKKEDPPLAVVIALLAGDSRRTRALRI